MRGVNAWIKQSFMQKQYYAILVLWLERLNYFATLVTPKHRKRHMDRALAFFVPYFDNRLYFLKS